MRTAIRITVLGLLGLAAASCGAGPSSDSSDSRAERRTQTFDFGTGRQATVLHHTFQVANTGAEPITVARVQTTCGCTVATVKKDAVIEPGKTLDVPVDLNLWGKKNPIESRVIVNYAGGIIPDELVLKGTVSVEYSNVVTLPKAKRGEQPEQVVTLATYPGQPPLEVHEIKFDPAKFDVTSKPGAKEGTIDVVFKLAANTPFGAVSDQVVVRTNDTGMPEKQIAARAHVLKPLEAVTRRLVMRPGKAGGPVVGVAEFKSTYGEPISDVKISVTREKRFTVSLEPDSPAGTVRVRVTAHPPAEMKKPYAQTTLRVTAKVGENEVEESMSVVYTVEKELPGGDEDKGADEAGVADAGKH